jgi:hypothetical protein
MASFCPMVTCRLTDRYGRVIAPCEPGSVVYTVLSSAVGEEKARRNSVPLAVEGYVAVYAGENRISPPIPFCILESVPIAVPENGFLVFQMRDFHCCAVPVPCETFQEAEPMKLLVSIETSVAAKKAVNLQVPKMDADLHEVRRACIYTNMVCSRIRFHSRCCISSKNAALRAEISQYSTIADGIKRTYFNSDELKEYRDRGILSPQEVSYYNVFVNGVMQPKTNYILKKGELTFTTQAVPAAGRPIMILFTTWKDSCGRIMDVCDQQYNAVSDGVKKIYTDVDEIREYGGCGIPSPCEISYFNLYSNGVLQPRGNYRVQKGVLQLTTSDAPVKGAPVILESIAIRDPKGCLFQVETHAYNAYSDGEKIYTDTDEIRMYGTGGIPDPDGVSFQNLFINAVIQPHKNYFVHKGCLVLETSDNPVVGAPVVLQSVKGAYVECGSKIQMSEAALAQWKKVYFPNAPT